MIKSSSDSISGRRESFLRQIPFLAAAQAARSVLGLETLEQARLVEHLGAVVDIEGENFSTDIPSLSLRR